MAIISRERIKGNPQNSVMRASGSVFFAKYYQSDEVSRVRGVMRVARG
jgi:hypothetical protein